METKADTRKFVAYYRVSKDSFKSGRSKSNGLGLDAQRYIVDSFYKDNIVNVFVETKSAKNITDRPELNRAIDYCLKNDCWLITAKLDRLSRNVDDVRAIIKTLNKRVVFCDLPTEGEIDMFMVTLFAAFAERERMLTSLRTKQALQAKRDREGVWQKGNPDMISGELSKKGAAANRNKAMVDENNIRASELIMNKKNFGWNNIQIAEVLNKNKFNTSTGGRFYPAAVERLYQRQMLSI